MDEQIAVEADRKLVVEQCKAVQHLSAALASLYRGDQVENVVAQGGMDDCLEHLGPSLLGFMENLGDMLNSVDAVSSEDVTATAATFEAARARWGDAA